MASKVQPSAQPPASLHLSKRPTSPHCRLCATFFVRLCNIPKDSLLSPSPALSLSLRGEWGGGFLSRLSTLLAQTKGPLAPALPISPPLLSSSPPRLSTSDQLVHCLPHQKHVLREAKGLVLCTAISPVVQQQLAHSRHSINHLTEWLNG